MKRVWLQVITSASANVVDDKEFQERKLILCSAFSDK